MVTCKDLRRRAAYAVKEAKAAEKAVYAANAAVTAAVKKLDPYWVTAPESQRAREAVKPLVAEAQRASNRFLALASEASSLKDAVAIRCAGPKRRRRS